MPRAVSKARAHPLPRAEYRLSTPRRRTVPPNPSAPSPRGRVGRRKPGSGRELAERWRTTRPATSRGTRHPRRATRSAAAAPANRVASSPGCALHGELVPAVKWVKCARRPPFEPVSAAPATTTAICPTRWCAPRSISSPATAPSGSPCVVSRRVGVNHRAAYRHFADSPRSSPPLPSRATTSCSRCSRGARRLPEEGPCRPPHGSHRHAYVAFADRTVTHYRIMFGRRLNEDRWRPRALKPSPYAHHRGRVDAGVESGVLQNRPAASWSSPSGRSPTASSLALVCRIKLKARPRRAVRAPNRCPFIAGL